MSYPRDGLVPEEHLADESGAFSYAVVPLADSDPVPGRRLWHLLCPQLLHLGETLLWCGRCHPQSGVCWGAGGHWADRDSLGFPDLSKWVTGRLA